MINKTVQGKPLNDITVMVRVRVRVRFGVWTGVRAKVRVMVRLKACFDLVFSSSPYTTYTEHVEKSGTQSETR